MRRICVIITLLIMYASVMPIPTYAKMNSNVSARNAVLMEQQSGRVLYGKAEHEPQKIASITKIMTALLAAESGKMKEMVSVSNEAVRVEGSAIYLKPGQKVKLEDLVYGLMLRSGNDAAQVIAESVGGSIDGFVYLMNEKGERNWNERYSLLKPSWFRWRWITLFVGLRYGVINEVCNGKRVI